MKKNIALLSWFNFCTDFIFFAPVAIIYFTNVTGSVTLGMSIFSIVYASSALFEIPTGILSDLVGRKKTIVCGSVCATLSVVFYAIGYSYWILSLGSVFQGLSRSMYSGNNDAFLHDTLRESGKEKEYAAHLGRSSSMFQVALAISSLAGGMMATYSFELVMWASVIPQICALIIALQMMEPHAHTPQKKTTLYEHINEAMNQFRQNYQLRLLTMASIVRFSLGESAFFLRSAFVHTLWPLWAVGIAQMLSNMFGALSFYFSGNIIDRFGALKTLYFEMILNRIVHLIALIFPTIVSPALMSTTSLTYGAGTVATNSLLQQEFTTKQRATMGSLNSFGGNIAFGIFSLVLGIIADVTSIATSLIIAHMLLLTPLIFYKKLERGASHLHLKSV